MWEFIWMYADEIMGSSVVANLWRDEIVEGIKICRGLQIEIDRNKKRDERKARLKAHLLSR